MVDADRGICYGVVQPGSEDSEGVPIVRVNNIRNAQLSLDNAMRVSAEIEAKYKRSRLVGGEVLLSLVGSLGETAKRRSVMEGKAMVVTMSRDIAARLYEAIKALRPRGTTPTMSGAR